MFWINFPASEPAESNYYLDGINERQPELAKKFKPRDRRGRKAKLINFEVPPEVCHEVELVATENVPINENAEEDFEGLRPKRAASNQHAGLGQLDLYEFIFILLNFNILILILFHPAFEDAAQKLEAAGIEELVERSRKSEQKAMLAKLRQEFMTFCEGNYDF